MNLVMALPWIQVSLNVMTPLEYHIWKKYFSACMAGLTYVMFLHDQKKGTIGEGPYVRRL